MISFPSGVCVFITNSKHKNFISRSHVRSINTSPWRDFYDYSERSTKQWHRVKVRILFFAIAEEKRNIPSVPQSRTKKVSRIARKKENGIK